MRKGWIIVLVLIIALIFVQQSIVFSQKTNRGVLLAQYTDTSRACQGNDSRDGWEKLTNTSTEINDCNIEDIYGNSLNLQGASSQCAIYRCMYANANNIRWREWCCVCFETEHPEICSQLFEVLTGTPIVSSGIITDIPASTNTPIPTHTPIPTATPVVEINTSRVINTQGGNNTNELAMFLNSLNPIIASTPTPRASATKRKVTSPPIPSATPIYTDPVDNQEEEIIIPTEPPFTLPTSSPGAAPTIHPINTPMPVPTERYIPRSLSTQTDTSKEKTSVQLDLKKLTEIKISVPNVPLPTDKPFLSLEQKKLAQSAPAQSNNSASGILITLEQKIGAAFITKQDELMVKRGNQFFSISNQVKGTNNQTAAKPQLEINANNVIARSSMGLSVDPLSGILTVETPYGPEKVSIMPDEALGIVLELKALNSKGVVEPNILLTSEKGALLYRISGQKVEKFLGFFPLPIQKQIVVSADTGSIIKVDLSVLSQVLSLFTF